MLKILFINKSGPLAVGSQLGNKIPDPKASFVEKSKNIREEFLTLV